MGTPNQNNQKGILRSLVGILAVALIASIGTNIYLVSRNDGSFSQNASDSSLQSTSDSSSQSASSSSSQNTSASSSQSISSSSSQSTSSSSQSTDNSFQQVSYLQNADQIYIMEAGILHNHLAFMDGNDHEFTYDFTNDAYTELKSKYEIEKIAGSGTEFQRVRRLMYEFGPRLIHESNYDNHVDMNALALLEYSLDNKSQGINCTAKAQILNEMCLALNIYARKVWLMPNSDYDQECHVVNEIWDSTLNKWVMFDITSCMFWADEAGTPLSVLEIREKGAMQEFCTPVARGDRRGNLQSLQKLKEKNIHTFLYIMKNMAYTQYCSDYTVGETQGLYLVPANLLLERKYFDLGEDMEFLISQSSIEKSPVQ